MERYKIQMAQEFQVRFGVPMPHQNLISKFGLRWHKKILSYLKIWSSSHAAHCTPCLGILLLGGNLRGLGDIG